MGAEVIGLYHIALSLFSMLTCITASGIPLTLSRMTAEHTSSGNENRIPSIIASSIVTGILSSVVIVILIFIFKGNLKFIVKDPRAIPLFLIMLPALISTTLYTIFRGWFWGKKDFKSFSLGELIEEIFRIIFTITLAGGIISSIKGATGIAIAFTVSDVMIALVMLYMFIRRGGRLKSPKEYLSLLKSSTPVTAMRLFSGIIASLTAFVIPAQLALYGMTINEATAAYGRVIGLAFPVIFIPLALTGSIVIVLIPEVSGQNILGNVKSIARKIDKTIMISVCITGLFLSAFIAYGREIGIILYNDVVAGEFIKAGAWMMIIICINQITSSVLNSLAMETTAFFNYVIGTLILIFLIYFLPRYIGIYALIAANGVYYLITLALNVYSLYKKGVLDLKFIKSCFLVIIFAIPSAYISRSIFEMIGYALPVYISTPIACIFLSIIYVMMIAVSDIINIKYFYIGRFQQLRTGS